MEDFDQRMMHLPIMPRLTIIRQSYPTQLSAGLLGPITKTSQSLQNQIGTIVSVVEV
jgi:hypothetical protein